MRGIHLLALLYLILCGQAYAKEVKVSNLLGKWQCSYSYTSKHGSALLNVTDTYKENGHFYSYGDLIFEIIDPYYGNLKINYLIDFYGNLRLDKDLLSIEILDVKAENLTDITLSEFNIYEHIPTNEIDTVRIEKLNENTFETLIDGEATTCIR